MKYATSDGWIVHVTHEIARGILSNTIDEQKKQYFNSLLLSYWYIWKVVGPAFMETGIGPIMATAASSAISSFGGRIAHDVMLTTLSSLWNLQLPCCWEKNFYKFLLYNYT